jgi:type I restriction enzyme S subunit
VKNIPKLRFFYPSSKILSNFEELVSSIWQRREMILEENINLSSLRDTLLPKLISGELKIPTAENLIEEANI